MIKLSEWTESRSEMLASAGFKTEFFDREGQQSIVGEHDRGFFEINDWDNGSYDYAILSADDEFDHVLVRGYKDHQFEKILDGIFEQISILLKI